jgi:DNA-binding beta-propeller fold protein YncE
MTLPRHVLALLLVLFTFACTPKKVEPPTFTPEQISWPPPPEPTRVRWLEHIANSVWAEPPTKLGVFLSKISGKQRSFTLKKPYSVTTDSTGRVFVSDTGWGGVLMFDRPNHIFGWRGDKGEGALSKASGLAVDSADHLYVSDINLQRVHEFAPDGRFIRTIGAGVLIQPVGMAIDHEKRRLWVVDTRLHGVAIFDLDSGAHIRTIGKRGSDDGNFNFPTNIAIGKEVYITDTFNFRVQVLDREGAYLRKWGRNCDSFGCFSRAKGIALDSTGNVYVTDAAFNNVQIFDPTGRLLLFFGGIGNGPGRMWLPAGMHITADDQVYVVSQYNWRVNIYQAFPNGSTEPQ